MVFGVNEVSCSEAEKTQEYLEGPCDTKLGPIQTGMKHASLTFTCKASLLESTQVRGFSTALRRLTIILSHLVQLMEFFSLGQTRPM